MKYRNVDARMLEAKFKYGNVLLGLAILHDSESSSNGDGSNEEKEVPVADQIRQFTRAVGPVLLPMIDQLSGLNESELMGYGLDNDS